MLKIRNVKMEDLRELVVIEQLCFTKEEAATREAFEKRIKFIPDSFFVAEKDGVIVGLVNGPVIDKSFITDDLFSDLKANPGDWRSSKRFRISSVSTFSKTRCGNSVTCSS